MGKQKTPRGQVPGVRRPQAARMQPMVRKAGMRNAKKPKGGK